MKNTRGPKTAKRSRKGKPATAKAVVVAPAKRVVQGPTLDRAAIEWAALLRDPCNAKLVAPCYPVGTGASVLMRFENDQIIANGATEVASFGALIPGAALAFQNAGPLTTDLLGAVFGVQTSMAPGFAFLNTNVTSARAVAACVQITYPGTELNRSGIVGIGVIPAEAIVNNIATGSGGGNITTSAAQVRIMTQHVERMPATVVEVKWFPGEKDAEPVNPENLATANQAQALVGRNAIVWSASGFPVSTGIRVRSVVIYEMNIGQTSTGNTNGAVQAILPPPSSSTPAQVLRAMYNRDPQWYIESAVKAAKSIGNAISYARQGAKLAGQVIGGIGMLAL